MVVSAIYDFNKKCVFYFSAIFPLIAVAIMGSIATWDNVGEIGRKLMYEEEKKGVDVESNGVEMKEVESGDAEVKEEKRDNAEVKNGDVEATIENSIAMEVKKEEERAVPTTNSA